MDCFPDFCIGCDSQAVDGFYCSESCRMADIERSSPSIPSSPVNNFAAHHSSFHFALPKSAKTHQCRHASNKPSPSRSKSTSASSTSPRLSPSSSRSSLTSNGPDAVPEEALKELLNYFNAFDRTRDQRRKSLPLSKQSHSWSSPDSQ